MKTYTIEEIEAIAANDFPTINKIFGDLHISTDGVLNYMTPQDVQQEVMVRRALLIKQSECLRDLDKQISEIEMLKGQIRNKKSILTLDKDRLHDHMIGLYVKEKELRNNP